MRKLKKRISGFRKNVILHGCDYGDEVIHRNNMVMI